MSKRTNLIKDYSGIFGYQVVLKNRKGKSVMYFPHVRSKTPPTPGQMAVKMRLKLASAYAKNALQNPALAVMYKAKATKSISPYRLAVNDYLRRPYIHKIDSSGFQGNPGDKITVVAGDDFKLDSVSVKILDPDGQTVEEGICTFNLAAAYYEYSATKKLPAIPGSAIIASARDIPGNITQLTITL